MSFITDTHGFPDRLDEGSENFYQANEYQDFIEFLQNELGFDEVKELQEKFYNQV